MWMSRKVSHLYQFELLFCIHILIIICLLFIFILMKNVPYQPPHHPLIVMMMPQDTVMIVVADNIHLPRLVSSRKDRNPLILIDPYHPLIHILTSHILLQQESH